MNIELIVKIFFINLFTYYIFFRTINNKKILVDNVWKTIGATTLTTIIYCFLKQYVDQVLLLIISYFIQIIFLKGILQDIRYSVIIINLIVNSMAYVGFFLAAIIELVAMVIFHISDIVYNIILIIVIEFILIILFFKINRFKNGFKFLQKERNNDYIDIMLIALSAIGILAYCMFGNYYGDLTIHLLISFIIIAVIMLIMIQKTLTLYYKQKLLDKTIEDYKNEISKKDTQIQKLSAEKYKISKLNHEFYNRQKSLERKVKEIVTKANLNMETANELEVMNQISSLTKEYSAKLQEIKELDELPSTDIEEIDDMFKYMQSECKENNIDFKLQVNGNIHHLVNTIIPQNKLVTLIGDHLRDAIIAVNSSCNSYKSIIAILGIKDNIYEFCVYDTGIEFEIDTLLKLGLEPATTHKETGGTGIGFMTTFETLKETNASLIIEEKHEMNDNDYTKAVIIRFDGKHEYKIRSYRSNQIGKSDRIIIEKI